MHLIKGNFALMKINESSQAQGKVNVAADAVAICQV